MLYRATSATLTPPAPLPFRKTQPISSSSPTSIFSNFDISKYKDWLHPNQVLNLFTKLNHPDSIFSLFHKLSSRPDYVPSVPVYTILLRSLSTSTSHPSSFYPHLRLLLLHLYCDRHPTSSWCKPTFPDHFFFTLISFYSSLSPSAAASTLFHMRRSFNCTPSTATFNLALKTAVSAGLFALAHHIYLAAPSLGVIPDSLSLSVLAEGLCDVDEVEVAVRLVEEFSLPPAAATVSVVVSSLCEKEKAAEAAELVARWGVEPNTVALEKLVKGLTKEGKGETAEGILVGMMETGMEMSGDMYREVVKRLMDLGKYGEVKKVMEIMVRRGVNPKRGVYKVVLKGLAEMGLWEDVFWVLGQMASRGYGPGLAAWSHLLHLLSPTISFHLCKWRYFF